MLYKFKLGHKVTETTKNIYCAKDEGAVDHSNQMVEDILLRWQEHQQSGKIYKCGFQDHVSSHKGKYIK